MEKKNLPSLKDLYSGDLEVLKNQNDLNILLNHEPDKKWLKPHPTAKKKVDGKTVPIDYLPIERVEYLLTSIFVKWRVEIKEIQTIANSVVMTIRLWYRDPITGEMDYQDGVGAAPIQTRSGAAATDFSQVLNDGVMKAAPAAKSYAVKDAAEQLGKFFGKDLNRADEIMYDAMGKKFDETAKYRKLLSESVGECQDPDIQASVMDRVTEIEAERELSVNDYKKILKTYFRYEDSDKSEG
jgi:hypothetical protein